MKTATIQRESNQLIPPEETQSPACLETPQSLFSLSAPTDPSMPTVGKKLCCYSSAPPSTPPPRVRPMVGSEIHAQHCSSGNGRAPATNMCFEDERGTGPRFSYPCLPASYPLLLIFKWREWEKQTHTYIWFILLHTSVHGEKILSWKKTSRRLRTWC